MDKYNFVRTFNNPHFNSILNDILESDMKSIFDMDLSKPSKVVNTILGNLRTDIKETDASYIVEMDIPGFNKEDINVGVENGVLTISAETKKETKDSDTPNEKYICRERYFGKYSRSFTFEGISEDEITASYTNGVLTVVLPKLSKTSTKKDIQVS